MRKPRRAQDWYEYSIVKRYADSETFIKDINLNGDLKVAVIFPNEYEIASSNLGFHYLYEKLNKIPFVRAERFFYSKDFSKFYSLDTQTPLDEFDIWAFSVHFEIDLLNIIDIFDKKSIPILRRERKFGPTVIIGGALTFSNPNLFFPIADILVCGDISENMLFEIFKSIYEKKKLPEYPNLWYEGKESCQILTLPLEKNIISSVYLSSKTVFKNMVLVEIGRGCIRKCKFCLAGWVMNPARFVKYEAVKDFIIKTGNELTYGFISATFTDYPYKNSLLDFLEKENIKFSVSSMRMDKIDEKLLSNLIRSGQKTLTVAPEGGSQRMRNIYAKGINEEHIKKTFDLALKVGFEKIKMYIIYGHPEEKDDDLLSIIDLGVRAKKVGFREVYMSINPLVPKKGTPFENLKFSPFKELKRKERFLRKELSKRGIRYSITGITEAFMEYIIGKMKEEEVVDMIKSKDKIPIKEFFKKLKGGDS